MSRCDLTRSSAGIRSVRRAGAPLTLVIVACFAFVRPSEADTHYVWLSGGNNPPYTNWANAARSIQDAVDQASGGDTVLVTNGSYFITSTITFDQGISLRSVNGASNTTIDAGNNCGCIDAGNSGTVIDGFTITRGSADNGGGAKVWNYATVRNCFVISNSAAGDGGGIEASGDGCIISNCVIRGNTSYDGGGLRTWNTLVVGCTVADNFADNAGGGIHANESSMIMRCEIRGNACGQNAGGAYMQDSAEMQDCEVYYNQSAETAGGVFLEDGTAMQYCRVWGNQSDHNGGGCWLEGSARATDCDIWANESTEGAGGVCLENGAMLQNCQVSNNIAGGCGGGVWAEENSIVSNCTVVGNSSGEDGGGLGVEAGSVAWGCIVSNNYADGGGGGIYLECGSLVLNSVISGNTSASGAGGVTAYDVPMSQSEVWNCVIVGNRGNDGGVAGLPVYNSLIAYNRADENGGGLCAAAAYNCTIVSNSAGGDGGGAWGSVLHNTIVYSNTAAGSGKNFHKVVPTYTCTTPMPSNGYGNIADDPRFVNPGAGDWRLQADSPCVNAGANGLWMTNAKDLDGAAPRILDSVVEMGAYEHASVVPGLRCFFFAEPTDGVAPLISRLTAYVSGTNVNITSYSWDFDNDGTADAKGPNLSTTNRSFSLGLYSVSLTVSNSSGQKVTFVQTNCVAARAAAQPEVFADAASASPAFPYLTWGTAARTMEAAIRAAGSGTVVRVQNGTYELSREIALDRGITVQSENGPGAVAVDGMGLHRCFLMSDPGSILKGLTIRGGRCVPGPGGGVFMSKGIVTNCTLTANHSFSGHGGGGIFVDTDGLVVGCRLFANVSNWGGGGGIRTHEGGTVRGCRIWDNTGAYAGGIRAAGGGMYENCVVFNNRADTRGGGGSIAGGSVFNTLFYGNVSGNFGGGLHLRDSGAQVVNCTIVGNAAVNYGGGIVDTVDADEECSILNTIIYDNTSPTGANWWVADGSPFACSNCCTTPMLTNGTGNITNAPLLTARCRLRTESPCIDAGVSSGAPALDMDGEGRWDHPGHLNLSSIVDIGADEFVDKDGDGVADYWEMEEIGNTNGNAATDHDGDALDMLGEYVCSTRPTDADTDGDLMRDGWEAGFGLDALADDASDDPDMDRFINLSEYVADTCPTNGSSLLCLTAVVVTGGNVRVEWKGGIWATQYVECAAALTSTGATWQAIFTNKPPTGVATGWQYSGTTNKGAFYRIRAERPSGN